MRRPQTFVHFWPTVRGRTQRVKRRNQDAASRRRRSSQRQYWRSTPRDAATMNNIVGTLFPEHPRRLDNPDPPDPIKIHVFTGTELSIAVWSMRKKRDSGPDGLLAELLKAICVSHPRILLDMYNSCLKAGIFPARWKTARLVLISRQPHLYCVLRKTFAVLRPYPFIPARYSI